MESVSLLVLRALDWATRFSVGNSSTVVLGGVRPLTLLFITVPVVLSLTFLMYQWWR